MGNKLHGGAKRLLSGSWLLIPLLLIAFALRLYRLADQSVWWDEGWTAWVMRQSFVDIARQTGHDVHPPLYFWLLHGWQLGSGDSEFALRFFSVLAGALAVAATYRLGRAANNSRATGILTALFVAVSRFSVTWSQEMRMYALAAFLAALGLWAALRLWERKRPVYWLLYVICMTAGLYTLYLFFPILVATNAAWLWGLRHEPQRRPAIRQWVTAQAAVLLLFIPWLAYALGGFLSTSSATPISVRDFLEIYWNVLTVGIPVRLAAYAPYTVPLLVVFLAGLILLFWQARSSWRQARALLLFLTGLLLPVFIVYLIALPKQNFYAPPFSPRYLVIFTACYAALLAWGIVRLGAGRRWPAGVLLTGLVVYVAAVGLRGYYPSRLLVDDYKSLVATLAAYERPNDAVILYTDTDWPIFAYHHPGDWLGVPHLWTVTPATADAYLDPIWQAHDGVWLVVTPYAASSDPQGAMRRWLAERATAAVSYAYGDKALQFYARTDERAAVLYDLVAGPPNHIRVTVAPDVQLVGYEQATGDYRSGDTIHLFLYWDNRGAPAAAEVGFMDAQGRSWQWALAGPPEAQSANAPTAGLARQQLDFVVPPEAPSGDYTFYVFNNQGDNMRFGQFTVWQRQSAVLTTADVTIPNRLDADFGSSIRLLGYDLPEDGTPLQPGDRLALTLYWQAQTPITQPYKVFTHLLGAVFNATSGNFLWGQQDNEPANNTRPTTTWRAGEVIVDSYAIPIDPQAPPGVYQLEIGLYDPLTGERLPVAGSDHLIVTAVTISQQ